MDRTLIQRWMEYYADQDSWGDFFSGDARVGDSRSAEQVERARTKLRAQMEQELETARADAVADRKSREEANEKEATEAKEGRASL